MKTASKNWKCAHLNVELVFCAMFKSHHELQQMKAHNLHAMQHMSFKHHNWHVRNAFLSESSW